MIARTFAALSALLLGACQHTTAAAPAVLIDGDDETLAALSQHLATVMGVARVQLGAGDPTQSATVSVLPPAPTDLEGRSPARPTQFTLMLENGACYAVRDESGERIHLDGVPCRAL